eukprot:SAG11_NODE_1256_length_5374_cov_5.627627_12_plen_85_part_00
MTEPHDGEVIAGRVRLEHRTLWRRRDDLPVREVLTDLMPPAIRRGADTVRAIHMPGETHVIELVAWVVSNGPWMSLVVSKVGAK